MTNLDAREWYKLFSAKGVGPKALHGIYRTLERVSLGLADVTALSGQEFRNRFGLDARASEGVASLDEDAALQEFDELRSSGVSVVHLGHELFPARLPRRLGDKAPALLFCLGDPRLLGQPAVAFSGARNGSGAGLDFTREVARALAASKVIISGHAKGVDSAAHHAAIEAEGQTIFVLPTGILEFRWTRGLREPRRGDWLAVSPFPPRQPWMAGSAMARNRLIAALADALVVVEAGPERDAKGRRSGSFDAGKAALQMGVPVFVASPSLFERPPEGNEELIRRGAVAIESAADAERISAARASGTGEGEPVGQQSLL